MEQTFIEHLLCLQHCAGVGDIKSAVATGLLHTGSLESSVTLVFAPCMFSRTSTMLFEYNCQ